MRIYRDPCSLRIFTAFQDNGVHGTTDNSEQLDMIKKLGFWKLNGYSLLKRIFLERVFFADSCSG